MIDICKGSGGEGTRDGKHVRRAERRQDSKTWDADTQKDLCNFVSKGLQDFLQAFNIDIAEPSLLKSPCSRFCPLSVFSGLSLMLWC